MTVADQVVKTFQQSGRNVKIKRCYQLQESDISHDIDLVISLGGDGTFLKTASMVPDATIPILGINTDPQRSVGCLCNRKIFFANKDRDIETLFRHFERENFEFFNRQRLLFEMEQQVSAIKHRHLSLNEIFVAEKEVAQVSIFSLNVNNDYIGKFKSSGLIISTGTGSTGWLYSAKRFTEINVERALAKLGAYNEPMEVYKNIAVALSEQTVFPPSHKAMYYFVREPIQGKGFQQEGQGFAQQMEFTSELIDGRVNIDGMKGFDVHLGDTFKVTLDPKYALRGIKFIV